MTIQIRNGWVDTSISRRGFVAGAASLTFAFTLGGIGRGAEALGAIADRGHGAGVWIVGSQGRVSWRPVKLATVSEDSAIVSAGLQPGERFVALGAHMLHQGEAVRIGGGTLR